MNKLHIISSGSKANTTIVESHHGMLLVDQGLSFKKFKTRCEDLGINIFSIKAILVTHEHIDHINGVPLTAKNLNIPVFATEKTIPAIEKKNKYNIKIESVEKDTLNKIGKFSFTPFSIMHDAADPVGYAIDLPGGEVVTIATDTGKITNYMLKYLSKSSYLLLEANHDKGMLYKNEKYPWSLKERIKGNNGHLSNDQCFDAIDRIGAKLKKVVMGHLSQENNCPLLLDELLTNFLKTRSTPVQHFIATQDDPFSILMK